MWSPSFRASLRGFRMTAATPSPRLFSWEREYVSTVFERQKLNQAQMNLYERKAGGCCYSRIAVGVPVPHSRGARGRQHLELALDDEILRAQYQVRSAGHGHFRVARAECLQCHVNRYYARRTGSVLYTFQRQLCSHPVPRLKGTATALPMGYRPACTYQSNGGAVPVEEIRDAVAQDRSSHTGGKVRRRCKHVSQQECLVW